MKIKYLSIKQASAKHLPKMILLLSLIFLLSLGAILQPPTSSFSQNETKMSQTKLIPKVAILTYANRYSIRAWSHNFYDNLYSHNQTSIFNKFIQVVNKQARYNVEGSVDAIPIIEYHNIDNQNTPYTTSIGLFTAEMKYLHDNGFTVLPMSAVGYNDTSKFLYLRMH